MQGLTEQVFALGPPGGLFDQTVIRNLFPSISTGARRLLLHRAVDRGEVLRVTRGIYCLADPYRKSQPHPFAVAALLCSPSHVSLESALAHHALIPEAVYGVTSATLQRSREYVTALGHFHLCSRSHRRPNCRRCGGAAGSPVVGLRGVAAASHRRSRLRPSVDCMANRRHRVSNRLDAHRPGGPPQPAPPRLRGDLHELPQPARACLSDGVAGRVDPMIEGLIETRVRELEPANAVEQENAVQEIMQAFVLASLARCSFFSDTAFQGGTCLRMLYGMSRFSEDLDFLLRTVDARFRWEPHLRAVQRDCAQQGIRFEVQDRSSAGAAVRAAFLKTDSIGKLLQLDLPFSRHASRKIKIKLEIDTNPPAQSACETKYLMFPVVSAITTQTLECGFATKSHALLCRSYTKGRDWYDFVWYVGRQTRLSYRLLANALRQVGPWAGQPIKVNRQWYLDAMHTRIRQIDWRQARADVARFVPTREQEGLRVWGAPFSPSYSISSAAYLPER